MNIKTRHSGSVVTPLEGYKLVVTIVDESIAITAKRKLKKDIGIKAPPIINYSDNKKGR